MNSVLKIVSAFKALSLSRTPREEDEQSDFVPMVDLAIEQLRSIVGGDGDSVDGTPRGGWKAAGTTTA
jgi:hypothetical protein